MMSTLYLDKARAAYGTVPDWVEELAHFADRETVAKAGERINYSKTVVSLIISGTYRGDMARVEGQVRGALMGLRVDCPVMGRIGRNECLDWQALPFAATDAMRMRVYRACRSGCAHARGGQSS